MDNSALNALWERAEIYYKMEETVSLLNPEEAAILTVYAENLLKTRPLRHPESCPESGQVQDTNCEFCAAGNPRLEDSRGFYHEISDCANSFWVEKCEEPANAQN